MDVVFFKSWLQPHIKGIDVFETDVVWRCVWGHWSTLHRCCTERGCAELQDLPEHTYSGSGWKASGIQPMVKEKQKVSSGIACSRFGRLSEARGERHWLKADKEIQPTVSVLDRHCILLIRCWVKPAKCMTSHFWTVWNWKWINQAKNSWVGGSIQYCACRPIPVWIKTEEHGEAWRLSTTE